ncbi:unnamed protein product [Didymodactylos carnosus]|nr:unnamed protein product [Didymodactylos carnosus]CAF4157666.1 unnamed protein product [Didymodactylos carnosus]
MRYTLELILSIQTIAVCLYATVPQYIFRYFFLIYINNSTHNNTLHDAQQECHSKSDPISDAHTWAQIQSAHLQFWMNIANGIPLVIMTYILGVCTTKFQKKIILVISFFGNVIQVSFWLLFAYFNLPLYIWFISSFLQGFGGGSGISQLVVSLIIMDTTLESERGFLSIRLAALCGLVAAVVNLLSGFWIVNHGFKLLFWLALAAQLITIVLSLVLIKESSPSLTTTDEETKRLINDPPHITKRKNTISIYLTLISYLFFLLAVLSLTVPYLYFLQNAPFCWMSKEIGIYSTVSAITTSIFSIIGMKILTWLNSTDIMTCIVSNVCFLLSAFWTAFAKHSWQLYAGLALTPFTSYQASLASYMLLEWLEPHRTTQGLIIVTEITTIIAVFGNSFFIFVYGHTVAYIRNFTVLLAASLCVIPLVLNIYLYVINKTNRSAMVVDFVAEPPSTSILPPFAVAFSEDNRETSLIDVDHNRYDIIDTTA